MKPLMQKIRPLFVPLAVAAASGLTVAVLTGAIKLDRIKDLLNLDSGLISPQAQLKDSSISQDGDGLVTKSSGRGATSEYSAVFLTNGNVYFGQLEKADSQKPILKDVFYLRAQRRLQPPEEEESAEDEAEVRPAQAIKTEFTLIKLGNELHGPTDQIDLNRDYVLFWEPLRTDSKVVQAIEAYFSQQ